MVMVTVSPGLSQRLGLRPRPTPGGVPVETMSPGSRGVMEERYSIELRNFEDEFAGVGVLQDFAVDGKADVESVGIGDFVGGDDGGTERAESGEALAHRPLGAGELDVAGTDIVDDRVAVDVITPCRRWNAITAFTDDEGEFSFVVGLGRVFGEHDGFAGSDDRGWELEENDGGGGDFHAGFFGVVAVVEADGEDARGIRKGRVKADILKWDFFGGDGCGELARDDVEGVLESTGGEIEDGFRVVEENAGADFTGFG